MADLPGQRFEEVVSPHLDVRGDEIGDVGVGAAEHDVLPGAFEVVVGDLERARAVVAQDGLRVEAVHVDVRNV